MDLNQLVVRAPENGTFAIANDALILTANPNTDWFHFPTGEERKSDVISAATNVPETTFQLKARVSVDFRSTYDAGALFIQADEQNWAKIAFEFSGAGKPTIVSVVTRTTSDDCDGPVFTGSDAWLRLYCHGDTVAFHFSEDGKYWHFLRWFTVPGLGERPVTVGFGAQSPTGKGCSATFEDIDLAFEPIADLRNGS